VNKASPNVRPRVFRGSASSRCRGVASNARPHTAAAWAEKKSLNRRASGRPSRHASRRPALRVCCKPPHSKCCAVRNLGDKPAQERPAHCRFHGRTPPLNERFPHPLPVNSGATITAPQRAVPRGAQEVAAAANDPLRSRANNSGRHGKATVGLCGLTYGSLQQRFVFPGRTARAAPEDRAVDRTIALRSVENHSAASAPASAREPDEKKSWPLRRSSGERAFSSTDTSTLWKRKLGDEDEYTLMGRDSSVHLDSSP